MLKQRLEHFSLRMTPAVLTTLMVLFAAVPMHIPGMAQVMPLFALISIYYWCTFAPGTLPYVFLFLLGLLEDTLLGLPLGVSSFVFLVFALMLVRGRNLFGKMTFSMVWMGFAALSFVAVLVEWLIMSFYTGHMLPMGAHLLQWGASCFAYPLVHLLFTRIYRTVVDA